MRSHSFVLAWWATIEVLLGRLTRQNHHLKDLDHIDWTIQEGVMAELLCAYDETGGGGYIEQGFGLRQGES